MLTCATRIGAVSVAFDEQRGLRFEDLDGVVAAPRLSEVHDAVLTVVPCMCPEPDGVVGRFEPRRPGAWVLPEPHHRAHVATRACRNLVRHALGERLEEDLAAEQARPQREGRHGRHRVHHRALLRDDPQGPEVPCGDRPVRCRERLEDEAVERLGHPAWQVDRAPDFAVALAPVDDHLVVGDRHGHRHLDRSVEVHTVVVDEVLGAPRALRHTGQGGTCKALTVIVDGVHRLEQCLRPVLVHDLTGPAHAGDHRGHLGLDVPDGVVGEPTVEPNDVEDVLVDLALAVQLDDGEEDALLEHVDRVEDVPGILLLEVEHVAPARGEPDDLVAVVDRCEHQGIERVRRSPVRVVVHEHVAGLHLVEADELDRALDAVVVAAGEHGDTRRVCNDVAVDVVDPDTVVVDLIDHGVV